MKVTKHSLRGITSIKQVLKWITYWNECKPAASLQVGNQSKNIWCAFETSLQWHNIGSTVKYIIKYIVNELKHANSTAWFLYNPGRDHSWCSLYRTSSLPYFPIQVALSSSVTHTCHSLQHPLHPLVPQHSPSSPVISVIDIHSLALL